MKSVGNPTDPFSGQPEGSDATELYCPKCKQSVPVRKRLLLVLPEGDKYEYFCAYCAETVGTKIDKQDKPLTIIT